jgi:hypothetical protein
MSAPASPKVPPARDGNIAIQQEFDQARKADRVEAFELFLARHPDHPLAAAARREIDRLRRKRL